MANFKLTHKAVADLTKIWEYTYEVWTEKQADIYYEKLITTCQEIAENTRLGKKYEEIVENLYGLKVNRHIIFYRTLDMNYVEITRVLHERMDVKSRLME